MTESLGTSRSKWQVSSLSELYTLYDRQVGRYVQTSEQASQAVRSFLIVGVNLRKVAGKWKVHLCLPVSIGRSRFSYSAP